MLIPTPCSFGYISHQYRDTRERASERTHNTQHIGTRIQTDGRTWATTVQSRVRIHRLRAVCSFTHSFDWYVSRFLALCRSQSLFPSLAYIRCACKCVWVLCVLCGYIAKKYIEINDDETNETNERTNQRTYEREADAVPKIQRAEKKHIVSALRSFIPRSFVSFRLVSVARVAALSFLHTLPSSSI